MARKRKGMEVKGNIQLVSMIVAVLIVGVILGSGLTLSIIGTTLKFQPTGAAIAAQPTPSDNQVPLEPAIDARDMTDDDQSLGNVNAPVTIVEFSDFQCPFCKRFHEQTFPQLKSQYIDTGKVRFVYRDFPLNSMHPDAQKASEASECADEQGKFWEYQNLIFANQGALDVNSLKGYAGQVGVNQAQFDSCLDSGKYTAEVQKDFNDGARIGVRGTPTFFVNGEEIGGAQPFSTFQQVIESLLVS